MGTVFGAQTFECRLARAVLYVRQRAAVFKYADKPCSPCLHENSVGCKAVCRRGPGACRVDRICILPRGPGERLLLSQSLNFCQLHSPPICVKTQSIKSYKAEVRLGECTRWR